MLVPCLFNNAVVLNCAQLAKRIRWRHSRNNNGKPTYRNKPENYFLAARYHGALVNLTSLLKSPYKTT